MKCNTGLKKPIFYADLIRLMSGSTPVRSIHKKQGNPPGMASFPAFFMFGHDENIASADERCALAVHDATRNQCTRFLIHTTDIKHRSRPGISHKI